MDEDDLEEIQKFLSQHVSWIDSQDNVFGNSPLIIAAKNGKLETLKHLLHLAVNVGLKSKEGKTAYHTAAEEGHLDVLKELVMHNDSLLNEKDDMNRTALYFAVNNNHVSIVKYLLTRKVDVSLKSKDNDTVFEVAARNGYVDVLKSLLTYKRYFINAVDGDQYTLLHLACLKGHLGIVEILLKLNIDVSLKQDDGLNACHIAAKEGHLQILQMLLNNNQSFLDETGFYNSTPLYLAAWRGHLDVVKYLLTMGANVRTKVKDGGTAYHKASYEGYLGIVEALVQHDRSCIDILDDNNCTPLSLATLRGHCNIVDFLLRSGADTNIKRNDGETVCCIAAYEGYLEIVKLLINSNPLLMEARNNNKHTPLYLAVFRNHFSVVKFLLAMGADVRIKEKDGFTVYIAAAYKGYLEILKLLVTYNNSLLNEVNNINGTPLFLATWKGHEDVVRYLLSMNVDVSIKHKDGLTVYNLAAREGHLNVLKVLLDHNRDLIDEVCCVKQTPLHRAARKGKLDVVRYLLEENASTTRKDIEGKTAKDLAVNKAIEECFILHEAYQRINERSK